jgi:GNAT superfamily N-acetyltransferase
MNPADVALVERFLQTHSSEPALTQSHWFDWQYVRNPMGCDVRVRTDGDAVAGVSGFVPCRVAIDGTTRTAAFSTNTLVAPAQRRRGWGRALHEARLRDYDWALSSGQSPENRRVYERLGFETCAGYRRVFARTSRPAFRPTPRGLREWYAWAFWKLGQADHEPRLDVRVDSSAPPADDAHYDRRFPSDVIAPRWDREHVVWRFEQHPYFTYQFASVFDRERRLGFGVVRETGTETILVDLYGPWAELPRILNGLGRHLSGLITGSFVGRSLDGLFRQAGWSTFPAGGQLVGKSNDPTLHGMLSERDWCFFGGDSDADRLRDNRNDGHA